MSNPTIRVYKILESGHSRGTLTLIIRAYDAPADNPQPTIHNPQPDEPDLKRPWRDAQKRAQEND